MSSDVPSEPLKFAYWVPNVSGGLVTSKIEQRTEFSFEYNKELAVLAENSGFEYALSQVRYASSYGAAQQHDPAAFSLGLLLATERLKLIVAAHPGLWHPAILAKFGITADILSQGRFAVNIVSGWFKDEFTGLGEPWLEHDERYRRTEEFIRVLRGLWTRPNFDLNGDFYRIHDFSLRPQPHPVAGRSHPEIFQGGNSTAARRLAGRVSDWYFSNGKDFDGFSEQVADVRAFAAENGRSVRFGLNGFVIARDTEAEAREVLREIVAKADTEAVEGFRKAVAQAGKSTSDGKGMWADSEFADLVQYNDGFRTGLVGTPEQIAHRIVEYKKRGADLLLLGFLHYLEDVEQFGTRVLPIVRELEAELDRTGEVPAVAAARR
ncbi:FMNH2-dependent dimethyl sulfone monooxygenase [Saccharopolyspora erythraea NRRL 2338]|uniref:Luciferase-like monooxygenase n=2 Tax=Saccharopolyspora erythraea TaxID=1836 RepID=A4FH08_SACEN|nr:dimethyl sulfone monooxygenase SfnG [Saccharopolyspora erythraea]EQD82569.1 alkanesulfonate monooxygenase [Saccharopolyspora erythraea D]PFG97036.1 FMNH2-dependent dimethyl sulfone monooxygenase [Saccharopolyspora erythraea NRRL 2338]QRK87244.1 dimethyl sulfone monooxygenase SfnG [Saccharopolyspora erythraea]CAM03333.1 luciferase-like monooxygenase [Saccharopolyspora erythraea NRRL 2338]